MNLQQLRFVRETARRGFSLTHAAQALGTSQPALSRGILDLEAELGVDVFIRHGKRVLGLTDPGRAILERAERVLADIEGIERITADFRARDDGELRIATTHTQARYVLPAPVAAFRKRYPAVRLTLLQGSPRQITQSLLEREVDVAIATEIPDAHPDLIALPCFEWQHVVLVPARHRLLDEPLTLAALVRHPIVTYAPEFAGRRRIDQAFADAGRTPDIVLAAIDADVIKTYVAIGLGVGIMAELAYDARRDRGLEAIPAGTLFGTNRVWLAVRRDAYLRGFVVGFIELVAPDADRRRIDEMLAPRAAAAPAVARG